MLTKKQNFICRIREHSSSFLVSVFFLFSGNPPYHKIDFCVIGTPFGQSIELKITGEGDITNAIAKGLQNQSLSTGNSTTINRRSVAGL